MKKIQIVVTSFTEDTGEIETYRLPVHEVADRFFDMHEDDAASHVIEVVCQHFMLDPMMFSETYECTDLRKDGPVMMISYVNQARLVMTQVMVAEVVK
jgi:hypothetical protein